MSKQEYQPPVREFRAGTITAALWEKTTTFNGKTVPQHSIRIQKRYRDERSGEWKTTTYFRPDDLPKLALVANKVFEHLTLKEFDENAMRIEPPVKSSP